ncbi:Glycosyltransferase [Granulibacter bethesdensis]|uniref:glycosyltransferase n=1 Tax=Granulibacter bethesdensis TaxID=364410 RepID=UPI00090CA0AD|nr:glycosyltransferase [Granulibacter bethesdensis]APH57361.1 Glycosyltransferase [Granulibacter bethesdensis]
MLHELFHSEINQDSSAALQCVPRKTTLPSWLFFDADWYAVKYGKPDGWHHYRDEGHQSGFCPNALFDEQWYVNANPDVRTAIERGIFTCGYDHYFKVGHKIRSPNWLFDEAWYQRTYPDLFRFDGPVGRGDFVNGFDHYLREGAAEGRQPGLFLDPDLWNMFRPAHVPPKKEDRSLIEDVFDLAGQGLYPRSSWYFDAEWYLQNYPAVAEEIAAGRWISPLAHYLGNDTPHAFNPNPFFSEEEYQSGNTDLDGFLQGGRFRNGYMHFLEFGIQEGRPPRHDLQLPSTDAQSTLNTASNIIRDPFALHIARQIEGFVQEEEPVPTESQTRFLFARQARNTLACLMPHGLDFSRDDSVPPTVSVMIVMHNQFHLTMQTLASLAAQKVDLEVILVDSGSRDETTAIERYVHGAKVIHFSTNRGYIAGCNVGLEHARGLYTLYLNNDVVLGPLALERAVRRLAANPQAGAVGGKIIRTNGALQEAGCIVWRDGRTHGYARDYPVDAPEANFVREVDFCSAAFLLTRTEQVQALGGFDPVYRPAYYEDTDLCLRLKKRGYVTLYDPSVVIHHYEYGSSSAGWAARSIGRARDIFCRQHRDVLRFHHGFSETGFHRARSARRRQLRILLVEDRMPMRYLGSGYVRTNDIIRAMDALGHAVTVFPLHPDATLALDWRTDFPDRVEVMHDRRFDRFADFLSSRPGMYDILWIARTHNLRLLAPVLDSVASSVSGSTIVLDTEAVVAPREIAHRQLTGRSIKDVPTVEMELDCARFAQRIIAVNDIDAEIIRKAGYSTIDTLGHYVPQRGETPGYEERRDLLFVGALHGTMSPNYDSLLWFLHAIMPIVQDKMGRHLKITLVGHVAPGTDTGPVASLPSVNFVGPVDDLAPLYSRHRVFVAPTRFAAGIPYKVHEAASYGIPVVASSLLCRQLGWSDGVEIADGGDDERQRFADRILALYRDETLWNSIRNGAYARILQDHSQEAYQQRLQSILEETMR